MTSKAEYYSLSTILATYTELNLSDRGRHNVSVIDELNAFTRKRIDLQNQPWFIELIDRVDSPDPLREFFLRLHPIVTNHYNALATLCRYH
jgi:hypothetical protein